MKKILIYGNSGTGKTTFARRMARMHELAYLDLDTVAWSALGVRELEEKSLESIFQFLSLNSDWVIEGCYGKMVELLVEECTELHFLNPGIEVSLRNNAERVWEPHKYTSKEEQDTQFEKLQLWVAEYESRDDEFSLQFHRRLFSSFSGEKREYEFMHEYNT